MAKVAQFNKDGFFVGFDEDYGGPMPNGCCPDLPEERPGCVAKRNDAGDGWIYIESHIGEKGFVNGVATTIDALGPLPEGWSDEAPPPSLDAVKERRIAEVDARTSALILAGFDYDIAGSVYRFGYSAEDQGNFTKAAVSATLALINNQAEYRQPWRGWGGDVPHTLSLTAQEFLALATYAGKDHQERCLASGWTLTEAIRNAATVEEVKAIVDDRE